MQYASSCVKHGFDYIQSKYHGVLQAAVAAFRAARLFNPNKVVDLQPNLNAIDSVAAFPFLNSSDILGNLKAELPQYLARATDISQQTESVDWWQRKLSISSSLVQCSPPSTACTTVFCHSRDTFLLT